MTIVIIIVVDNFFLYLNTKNTINFKYLLNIYKYNIISNYCITIIDIKITYYDSIGR